MKLLTKKALGEVAALTFILFLGTLRYATRNTERNAERFYRDALRLEVGNATSEDVLRLAKSSGGNLLSFQPCLSGGGDCIGTVFFENLWLHRLHLAPPVAFGCRFTIRDYRLRNRWIEMESSAGQDAPTWGAFVNEGTSKDFYPAPVKLSPDQKYFRIIQGFPAGFVGVWLAPNTPADLKSLAYNFNFDCLVKIKGCRTVEEMLPVLARKDLFGSQDETWLDYASPTELAPLK